MRKTTEASKRRSHTRAVFVLAVMGWSLGACKTTSPDSSEAPQFMFVQSSDGLIVDTAESTFRLTGVHQQTLYFSDRPERIAGHLKMADYLREWTEAEGQDNFSNDPPNAVLSVYEPGSPDNSVAVVEISHPIVEGGDMVYSYKLIEGALPEGTGPTTLFIDRIGLGGGVGVGFHGVGVGRRGIGIR